MSNNYLQYDLDVTNESVWILKTPNKTIKDGLLYAQEVGEFVAMKDYYTRREGLNSFLINYVVEGNGILEYDNQAYDIHANQLFLIDCEQYQYYRTGNQQHWSMMWIHFYGPTAKTYYELFRMLGKEMPIVSIPPQNNVIHIIQSIITLCKDSDSTLISDIKISGYLTQLLVDILDYVGKDGLVPHVPIYVREVYNYIESHYSDKITLLELEKKFAVSKYHLQKQFKAHIGCSPNDFLLRIRLNWAKEFLRTTNESVAKIANDVGFENISYFINQFKRQEGTTPAKYRSIWM